MADTRENILNTALRLFARDGYEAVCVSTIAGELGMTKGALYKHYKNKRDIFDSIGLEVPQVTQIAACAGEEYGLWTGEPLPITMEQLCRRIRGDESGNED